MISTILIEELDRAHRQQLLTYELTMMRDVVTIVFWKESITRRHIVALQQYIQSTYNYEAHIKGFNVGMIVYDRPVRVTHL